MTIQDVADKAQVSKATVSRVINGRPGVKEEIRSRVKAVIQELGWKPSSGLWASSKIPSGFIGVVMENLSHPLYRDIINGISATLAEAGMQPVFFRSANSPAVREKGLEYFASGIVDGLILMESDLLGAEGIAKAMQNITFPVVFLEDDKQNAPSVAVDNLAVGKQAGAYLASLGHQRIGHITGNYNFAVSRSRYLGFVQALMEAGLETDEKYVAYGDFSWESGYSCMKQLMELPERPTAVYASSDAMAYGAWKYAEENGIRVPEDLSLVGTDGVAPDYARKPVLTTIVQPAEEMGRQAALLLLERIRDRSGEIRHVRLDCTLHEGSSCAPRK